MLEMCKRNQRVDYALYYKDLSHEYHHKIPYEEIYDIVPIAYTYRKIEEMTQEEINEEIILQFRNLL